MKNKRNVFFLIFLATVFASGCSGFYHLQYSKLKKVPATPEISSITSVQKKRGVKQNNFPAVVKVEEALSCDSHHFTFKKDVVLPFRKEKINSRKSVLKNSYGKIKLPFKKIRTTVRAHIRDHHILLILGLFCLGALLFGYGIAVFLLAFVAPTILLSAVCVIGGIALFLLGLLPFFGLVSMIVGDRFQSSQKQFEEKSKRRSR
jgi:hypothetical protein